MVECIECYPEYLKHEKFVRILLKILTLSFIPGKYLKGFRKITIPVFAIYCLTSVGFTTIYFKRDLMKYVCSAMIFMAYVQLLTKSLSVLFHSNELETLLQFIQKVHEVHEVDLVTISARRHLKRIIGIIKIILRYVLNL